MAILSLKMRLFRFGSLYYYVPSHTSPKHPLPKDSLSRNLVRGISANEVGGCLHKDCTVEVKFHKVSAIGKGCKEEKGHYGGDEQTNKKGQSPHSAENWENFYTAQFYVKSGLSCKKCHFDRFRGSEWSVGPNFGNNSSSNLLDRKFVEFSHCELPWWWYYY